MITLTAPDGSWWSPSWQGNDIEAAKLVGQFNTPLADGTVTQDLGSKGLVFPLTLSFEGDYHDKQAFSFLRALSQRGPWTVTHPVYGDFILQPISATLSAQPVSSGNITKIESSWIETALIDTILSVSELSGQLSDQVDAVNASASAQFQAAINLADPEAMAAAAIAGVNGLASFSGSKLFSIIQGVSDVQGALATAYAGAQAALTAVPMDVINAASQIQTLIQFPAVIIADLGAKVTAFGDFAGRIMDSLVPGSDADSRNQAVMSELYLAAAVTGAAEAVVASTPTTREQAIQAITDVNALLTNVTAALDAVQTASAGNLAVDQYFSNSLCFADLARLTGLVAAYLLRLIFDLKVAERFTLTVPKPPIRIAIEEYGTEYSSDGISNFDLFIASNALHGNDIILLPAGREVVVYV